MIEPIVLLRGPDGRVCLQGDHWPQDVEFSGEVLKGSPLITVDGTLIELSVFNGYAFYEMTAKRRGTGVVEPVIEVVSATLLHGEVLVAP